MANKPIRALVEAVYTLQQIDDDPNEVTWEYAPRVGMARRLQLRRSHPLQMSVLRLPAL